MKIMARLWDEVKDKAREVGWLALMAFLRWLVERLTANPGDEENDADSAEGEKRISG